MTITKHGRRFWRVEDDDGSLVCVACYREGAREVVRRLNASRCPAPQTPAKTIQPKTIQAKTAALGKKATVARKLAAAAGPGKGGK